ncbi:hypothetical protein D3C80_1121610 [compost metagenome]
MVVNDNVTRDDIDQASRLVRNYRRIESEENLLAMNSFMDGFTEDAKNFIYHEVGVHQRIMHDKVTRDVRALRHRNEQQLSDHFPVDGEKQPEQSLCDAWNNLLVWEKNRQCWSIVSLSHYESMKVCYSHWAYLPKMPHSTLGLPT